VTIRAATKRLFEKMDDEAADVEADFVVAPRSLEEAREVMVAAVDAGLTVGFRGGGTHQGIGNPVAPDVVVTTSALSRIVDWQPEDMTVVVEPGLEAARLAATLAERNQNAVLLERPGAATVGGIVAAGLSGFRRLRYGPTRDRVLEIHLVTGYGEIVRAGSSVVKSSTGYDLPRLATGSLGSLGLIGRIRLKLWTEPLHAVTVHVDDVEQARGAVFRPLAALESDGRGAIYLAGTEDEIEAQAGAIGGSVEPGLRWPDPIGAAVRISVRVPPRDVSEVVERVTALGGARYVASFGVGDVSVGIDSADASRLGELRAFAESRQGSLVLLEGPDRLYAELGAWGTTPGSIDVQRRVKAAFDPSKICNPGILPGGV
jgi:glycolate oxidase FAD binding subunit